MTKKAIFFVACDRRHFIEEKNSTTRGVIKNPPNNAQSMKQGFPSLENSRLQHP